MKKILILSLLLASTQANAARYLCIVSMERGHTSFFAETNAGKKIKEGWAFREVLPNGQYVDYGFRSDNGKGIITFFDSKTKEQIAEGKLSCNPTGK